jgi:hypothetical protein
MSEEIIHTLKLLPLYIKSLFFGLTVTIVGLVFRWFESIDGFENGINYNAFSGPAYISGYAILLVSIYSLFSLLKYLKSSNCEFNQLKKYYVEKWAGLINLFLCISIMTVYMSPNFLSTVDKEIGNGFYISLAGCLITILGTILFKTKNCDKMRVSKNQLNLNLGLDDDLFDFKFHTDTTINNVKAATDPVLKEQLQKQKEIADKINNK